MKKYSKPLTIILCVSVLFVMVFSVAHIFFSSSHECIGEDCSVCTEIKSSTEIFKIIALTVAVSLFLGLKFYSCIFNKGLKSFLLRYENPIILKVKISA